MTHTPDCTDEECRGCRWLTPREERRYSKKVVWEFTHRGRYRPCGRRLCWTCICDRITGRHKRNAAAFKVRLDEFKRKTDACEHDWQPHGIWDDYQACAKRCGTIRRAHA